MMNQGGFSPVLRIGKGILLGLAAALVAAAVFACLFSGLLALGAPDRLLPLFAHLLALAAGGAAGFAAGMKLRSQGLVIGLCSGGAVFLLHLLAVLCFGSFSVSCLTYGLAEVLGGALGGISAVNLRS